MAKSHFDFRDRNFLSGFLVPISRINPRQQYLLGVPLFYIEFPIGPWRDLSLFEISLRANSTDWFWLGHNKARCAKSEAFYSQKSRKRHSTQEYRHSLYQKWPVFTNGMHGGWISILYIRVGKPR